MRFDPSIVLVSLLLVKLSVQSFVCLFWCRQLVVCKAQVADGIGSVAFVQRYFYYAHGSQNAVKTASGLFIGV